MKSASLALFGGFVTGITAYAIVALTSSTLVVSLAEGLLVLILWLALVWHRVGRGRASTATRIVVTVLAGVIAVATAVLLPLWLGSLVVS